MFSLRDIVCDFRWRKDLELFHLGLYKQKEARFSCSSTCSFPPPIWHRRHSWHYFKKERRKTTYFAYLPHFTVSFKFNIVEA